jgi:Glycosyl-hydrolase 97 N-terminal
MYTHGRLATLFALAFAASSVVPAQTPAILKSPDGALELSIAADRGQSVHDTGGQLAYRGTFRDEAVLDSSNLGLAIQGAPVLGSTVRIESAKTSANDETWNSIAGKANPIQNHYNAVTVQTIEAAPAQRFA